MCHEHSVYREFAVVLQFQVAPYKLLRVKKDDGSVATHFLQENVPEFRDEMTDYEKQSADNQVTFPSSPLLDSV